MDGIDTSSIERFLEPYLPSARSGLFVTVTWAQSLDARIAAAPGERTRLSSTYTKVMTHYLRWKHDAILIGKSTVHADDPRLNCRYKNATKSPRPVILDSSFATRLDAKVMLGSLPPYVVAQTADPKKVAELQSRGGDVLFVENTRDWKQISDALQAKGITSVMVEGGAQVLDTVLPTNPDSLIVTIAPKFLGPHGVQVSPHLAEAASKLKDVQWWSSHEVPDTVLAAHGS